jgi:hypothetical protein
MDRRTSSIKVEFSGSKKTERGIDTSAGVTEVKKYEKISSSAAREGRNWCLPKQRTVPSTAGNYIQSHSTTERRSVLAIMLIVLRYLLPNGRTHELTLCSGRGSFYIYNVEDSNSRVGPLFARPMIRSRI